MSRAHYADDIYKGALRLWRHSLAHSLPLGRVYGRSGEQVPPRPSRSCPREGQYDFWGASQRDCSRSVLVLCFDSGRCIHSFDYTDTMTKEDDTAAKAAVLMKATEESQVAAAATALAWPTAG